MIHKTVKFIDFMFKNELKLVDLRIVFNVKVELFTEKNQQKNYHLNCLIIIRLDSFTDRLKNKIIVFLPTSASVKHNLLYIALPKHFVDFTWFN